MKQTVVIAFFSFFLAASSHAQTPQPPEIAARAYLLLDVTASQVLAQKEADTPVEPASLTKLMTAYLVFDALRQKKIMLVGTAVSHFPASPLPMDAHEHTLVIHGESDDTVALSAVMDWARPQQLPVTVFPGTGHFFHGQLPLLKSLAMRHLRA